MELKDTLIAGNLAEKQYLKANKLVKNSKEQEQAQEEFIAALGAIGFTSIADYQKQVKLYGHYGRTLEVQRRDSDYGVTIPQIVEEAYSSGKDVFVYCLYDHTVVYLPKMEKANELVDLKYCQKHEIEVAPDTGSGGAYIAEPGNIGVLFILQRPALAEGMEKTLKEVMQSVLLNRYGVKTYLETNELMTKEFIAPLYLLPCTVSPPNGMKIWGDTCADLGKVSMCCGCLTLEYNTAKAGKILKPRPNHPDIKEPCGLNDLLGKKLDPHEVLAFFLAEWLKATQSNVAK